MFDKFISLSNEDRFLLAKAALLLVSMRIKMLLPFLFMRQTSSKSSVRLGIPVTSRKNSKERLAWAVSVVGNRLPGTTCLSRALTLQALLHQNGYPADVRIGVTKDEKGRLEAHAWVESERQRIMEGSGIERFRALL